MTRIASGGGAPEFSKPEPPEITELRGDLDRLAGLLRRGEAPDGSLDVAALERRIEATGDHNLKAQFEEIKETFLRPVEESYTSGCDGTVATRTVREEPRLLSRDEVQRTLAALAQARSELAAMDADGDGRISNSEIDAAPSPETLEGRLARASTSEYQRELESWVHALWGTRRDILRRKELDAFVTERARFHARTPQGQAAIEAAYRDLLTRGSRLPDLEAALWDAENNFFTRLVKNLPIFGGVRRGHLSDKEIASFLGTDDLRAFTERTYAEIEARTGGPYHETFLAGTDLEGSDQLDDPDFVSWSKRFFSSCS